jgi:hypothetical protein
MITVMKTLTLSSLLTPQNIRRLVQISFLGISYVNAELKVNVSDISSVLAFKLTLMWLITREDFTNLFIMKLQV